MILSQCKPEPVFRFFEEISQIPRGSGNEKAVSDHIAAFARNRGLQTVQDEYYNLVIYKPGTAGYENHPPLILQGHMDMVCEKNKDTVHDFLCDPIRLRVEGDHITAEGTTLGADNGIAVALAMALLEAKDLAHPPLEVLLTADEEAGMSGAENLDASLLKGRRMINMDTDFDDTFFAGCAGGVKVEFNLPAEREPVGTDMEFWLLEVKGLKGGHSGAEIHNERGNSIRILARVLHSLSQSVHYRVASVSGGMKLNAIPREAEALLAIPSGETAKAEAAVQTLAKELAAEYRASDPGLAITAAKAPKGIAEVLTAECGQRVIDAGLLLPYGVLAMSMDIPGLVETSNNIGVLETKENTVTFSLMPRSALDSRIQWVKTQISTIGRWLGANVLYSHEYPAWEYDPESKLRQTAAPLYQEMFHTQPKITAIHAGLECGILGGKLPGLDIISFGPNAYDLHTPDERLSISSTARVWDFLTALLKIL